MGTLQSLLVDYGKEFVKSYLILDVCFQAGFTIRDFTRLALTSKTMVGWILSSFELLQPNHFDHLVATLPHCEDHIIALDVTGLFSTELCYPLSTTGGFSIRRGYSYWHLAYGDFVWISSETAPEIEPDTVPKALMRHLGFEASGKKNKVYRQRTEWPRQECIESAERLVDLENEFPWQFYPLLDPALNISLHAIHREDRRKELKRFYADIGFNEDAVPPPPAKRARLEADAKTETNQQ